MDSRRPFGVARDIQQIREGTAATAAELREFLKQMQGKSPQEVLGQIAQSSLVQSTLVATMGCLVLLAAGTVVPWVWGKAVPPAAPAAASATTPQTSQPAGNAPSASPTGPVRVPTGDAPPTDSAADAKPKPADDLLDRLGVGETKTADPGVNPLDKSDDLLKDIK